MSSDEQQLMQLPSPHGTSDDDDADASVSAIARRAGSKLGSVPPMGDEEDYAEDTAKLARLRRSVTALRACRMITVWPSEEDEDRVSGR